MWNARLRLVLLWMAHVSRVMADNCLRIYVALEFARLGENQKQSAWHLVTLLVVVPAVLLAPLNGAICNSLSKRWVLVISSVVALLVVDAYLSFGTLSSELVACWALVAVTSAINGPVRYALLPAAAQDTGWPLTRVNGLFELGSAAAIIAGVIAGASITDPDLMHIVALHYVRGLLFVAIGTALYVTFQSDIRRPERPAQAIAGFFADCKRIWAVKEARGCLLGLAALRGIVTGLMGALIATSLDDEAFLQRLLGIGLWIMAGVGAGSFIAGLQKHPYRVLGLVPWGASGLAIGLAIAALGELPSEFMCVVLGMMVGLVNVPLAATYQADLPPDARGNGMAARNFADYFITAIVAGVLYVLGRYAGWTAAAQLWLLAGLTAALALLSWRLLLSPVFMLFLEFVVWPIYRIKGYGPGIALIPPRGPVLVIANHTAWMDPVWAGKVLPRKLVGMLTSVFFDIPALRFVVTNLAETIRVELSGFRREVPELKKAIEVLDRGDCILMFPEGALRKKEENLLKQFGQGVWRIVSERPHVPVVVCWMEGGWGCYFSYWKGPPTKNKRFDFWRRIRVAVSEPIVVPADILANHRTTRQFLMQRCLDARRYLGLDVPDLPEIAKNEE